MEFEWDEANRLANLCKHGIDFLDVSFVFEGDTLTVEDNRYDYGEQRFVAFGLLQLIEESRGTIAAFGKPV
jgi:uncharacterized DUF497 family protein